MRRVDIVGGGIAGLTLAASLDPGRFQVTVHEAQPERAGGGAALGLWPAARRALADLGAWEPLEPKVSEPGPAALHTLAGRPLVRVSSPPLAMVERAALLSALDAAVPAQVRRVHADVADPAALAGDLVIGADGVRSRVRALVSPTAGERSGTPWVALRGISTRSQPRATPVGGEGVDRDADEYQGLAEHGEFGEYWGPGRLFGLVPLSAGRVYWFTTHAEDLPEPLDPGQVLDRARVRFADAAPVVRRTLVEADPQGSVLATRLWVAPPLTRYVRGRYVVIGDAAHASLPNLGRGACDAIVDAHTLARSLNGEDSLRRWQAARVPVTQAARLAAGAVMRLAVTARLRGRRDALLGTLGRVRTF
ncbi:MAG: FAD-dependent monooxygenase [Actinomycetales bacterium]